MGLIEGITTFFKDVWGNRYEASPEDLGQSIALLNDATGILNNINDGILTKASIVYDALGEYSDSTAFGNLDTYVPILQEQFNNLIKKLTEQQEIIRKYNNASGLQKWFATRGVLTASLFEGVGSFFEDLVDSGAVIISGIGNAFGADTTSIQLWASKDLVGDLADSFYANTSVGQWLNTYRCW